MTEIVPGDYASTLNRIKGYVHESRYLAQHRVNTELLRLYWRIGATLNERQRDAAWGANVVGKLADDLRAAFPSMSGFSRTNLFYMRRVAEAWPDADQFVQQAAGQIPWTQLTLILDKIDDPGLRDWYAAKSAGNGWSRAVLEHQIRTNLHHRAGAATTNYADALGRADSDLAQEITKDPYALGFLTVDSDISEIELERRLVERIIETLRELGPGFAFVGRQVHFEVNGDDFFIDLLFFHVDQLRYVVIELKAKKFDPRDAGQLGFYVALVEDRLRRPQHQATVGMLLVADKNDSVARYALAGSTQPIAVSRYELSDSVQAALPSEDAVARAVDIGFKEAGD